MKSRMARLIEETIDCGDAVGIYGNQADTMPFAEMKTGRQLGDGGRLPYACGADERH